MDRKDYSLDRPTDDQLRERTEQLLKTAEEVSLQLKLQTERLANAIDLFDRDILYHLRRPGPRVE